MDSRDYFRNGDVPLSQSETAMEVPWTGTNCFSELPYLNPNSSFDLHYSQYESSLSSIVSSPVAPSSALCDLIGKFGGSGTVDARHSNFGNPVSLPNVQFSIVDPRNPNLGDPAPLPPPLPQLAAIAADPAFIERAAKFSCFGSRCFNGRTSSIGDGSDSQPFTAARDAKLPRVSRSPALKPPNGSPLQNRNSGQNLAEIKPATVVPDRKSGKSPGSTANSNEESSVSDQIETATEANSRKRKGRSRGKPKEEGSASVKVVSDDGNAKESKPTESAKTEPNNEESEKPKADKKPLEPPKDYIHVRARRGQATDSHSLAERVRREKISERMKLLQDLVPGCNKITGKALMLDEIINYVQSLQHQVEFLSMKLASVNPSLDFNMENLLSRDAFQRHHNTSLPQPQMYPLDASANGYRQNVQQELHDANVSRGALVDPSTRHFLHRLDGFSENLPQFPGFTEDDFHSIVQMGFIHNSVNFPDMKVER